MLAWIGIALLSVSWLLGLSYYHQIDYFGYLGLSCEGWLPGLAGDLLGEKGLVAWAATVVLGTGLLMTSPGRLSKHWESAIALCLGIPALVTFPWPYRAAPLLLTAGFFLHASLWGVCHRWSIPPRLERLSTSVSGGAVIAGCVLLAQSLTMLLYESITARSHELPGLLPEAVAMVARLLGMDVAVQGSTLAIHSMRIEHMLGATWELLLDPVSLCFIIGTVVLFCWQHWSQKSQQQRLRRPAMYLAIFLLLVMVWLPCRAGLALAIYMNDVLRTDYDAPLESMILFWNPWLHFALLFVPMLLAWRLLRVRRTDCEQEKQPIAAMVGGKWRRPLAVVLTLIAVAMICFGVLWDPVGHRMKGRVLVEEYHPDGDKGWERTDIPFDTEAYGHLADYNYWCIYDYCSRFYDMDRLTEPINRTALENCDVLILKTPTRSYSKKEIVEICRFVKRGGGLLLIGEHTNVWGTGTYLNGVAEKFGFTFRYDCLFGVDSVFDQLYEHSLVPHPVVQNLPPMDFATSCSIDPGSSRGRAVIRSTGLKNLTADYHVHNFYPRPEDRPDMCFGAFVQLWSTRHGKGRVLAFSDSTIFSNFATFEPGKAELMLGMIEWLNHRTGLPDPRPALLLAGLVSLTGGLFLAWGWDGAWVVLVAVGLATSAASMSTVQWINGAAMPMPKQLRPMVTVVMDSHLSDLELPKNGFIAGKEDGFGLFERWIIRLGYFTSRPPGSDILGGDLAVIIYPNKKPSDEFLDKLAKYVSEGGKVLVLDSPQNKSSPAQTVGSATPRKAPTTDTLLEPFGLSVDRGTIEQGQLTTVEGFPSVPIEAAHPINGGEPFAWIDGKPVGSSVRYGKGSVTLVGFARFSDAHMGVIADVVPDVKLRKVFDLEFSLIRAIIEEGFSDKIDTPVSGESDE